MIETQGNDGQDEACQQRRLSNRDATTVGISRSPMLSGIGLFCLGPVGGHVGFHREQGTMRGLPDEGWGYG
jgi:hypothetical protein